MPYGALELNLWLANITLTGAAFAAAFAKRQGGHLNTLLVCLGWYFSYSAGAYALYNHVRPFYYGLASWIGAAILNLLFLILIYSFWRTGFASYRGLHRLFVILAAVTLTGCFVVIAYTANTGTNGPIRHDQWLNQWFLLCVRSLRFAQSVMLLLFLAIVAGFSIRASRTLLRLAAALLAANLLRLIPESWIIYLGRPGGVTVNAVQLATVLLLLLAWNATILAYPAGEPLSLAPVWAGIDHRGFESKLENINRGLQRILW